MLQIDYRRQGGAVTNSATHLASDIAVAHVDDARAVEHLLDVLQALHGPDYAFAVGSWAGRVSLRPPRGRVLHRFVISTEQAAIDLHPGDRVRGVPANGPYQLIGPTLAKVTAPHREALWPGDVACIADGEGVEPILSGSGTYFDVITEATAYTAPRLVMLRHLPDKPGGCAAYTGAFRREALPPEKPPAGAGDQRGVNRVNEHTLDMRQDRDALPVPHYHGPVSLGQDEVVNHSETAIVLPRSVYNLPDPDQPDAGRVVIYCRPADDPADQIVIPVRPGSIVVTPATRDRVMGHAFENAFAMLVAIPGFVAPHHPIRRK